MALDKSKKHLCTYMDFISPREDGSKPHVALVSAAANQMTTLLQKSSRVEKEVTLDLTMVEFLRVFLDMYTEDAQILAGILGYSTEVNPGGEVTYKEYLQDKIGRVTLLKSAQVGSSVPESLYKELTSLKAQVGDKVLNKSGVSPQDNEKSDIQTGESGMSKEMMAALEKQKNEFNAVLEKQQSEIEALRKSEELLKARAAAHKKEVTTEFVKTCSYVEDQTGMVKALMEISLHPELEDAGKTILSALTKANTALEAALEGANSAEDAEETTPVSDQALLKTSGNPDGRSASDEALTKAMSELIKQQKQGL